MLLCWMPWALILSAVQKILSAVRDFLPADLLWRMLTVVRCDLMPVLRTVCLARHHGRVGSIPISSNILR